MGGEALGWLTDSSLIVDEFWYIEGLLAASVSDPGKFCLVRKLKYFHRYRDDCNSLNCGCFLEISRDIYPSSLSLTQENDSLDAASVLDMGVSIRDGRFITKVYCKADDFPFHIVTFPFLDSNIDNRVCYGVFFSQTLRYQRLSTFRSDFEVRVRNLVGILLARNYRLGLLRRQFLPGCL